jgi:putative ABC transport system substrate-binding protein
MRKNVVRLALCALLFALCVTAQAQLPKKIPRIGYLMLAETHRETTRFEGIRLALRELGYIDGQNITIEYRSAKGKPDRVAELAAELARLKVDIIVAGGGDPVVRATQNATKTIPVVIVGAGIDPVVAGHVESLARPGGNVTGITNLSRELGGRRLELLKEAVPKIVRVAVLYESNNPGSLRELKDILPVAARALGLTVRSWEIQGTNGFDKVFAAINKERPDGLYVTSSPLITANLKRTVGFALKSRLASVGSSTEYVDAGGLMSYDADLADGYRRVATYVDKILKGAKPADLPVQQPTKFEFVINLKTAKQIGVTIPQKVLGRADKVIK